MVRATVGSAVVTAVLSAGAAAAPLGPDWPALEGRWTQTTRTLPTLSALAIVRCGDGLCGHRLRPAGPPALRLLAAEGGTATGTLALPGGEVAVYAFRDGAEVILRTSPRRLPGGTAQAITARFVRADGE